ncbi:hypothetical protein ARALYDRAFT_901229 [Arabidopsis lyrata subsp. lyrata]|uniref:Uncharacterized protein n=1 Tax=Arabidopsis lyrata subsp. lyrata TaxID=81972 RepID=D7LBG5_ARALL|nr:hypothetical protein ARALYDRAFT_901229 [Arabidopsis lyrata subsp. lyrata]
MAYEPYDYSLNFDQGQGWHVNHDDLRIFLGLSLFRFADPTRIRATYLLLYKFTFLSSNFYHF